jgi:hypothetical protein
VTGRVRLGDMARAGARSVSQYTGTVLAMFVVQFVAAWIAGFAILLILDGAFGQRPIFDDAVDGDLVALLIVIRNAPAVVAAVTWVVIGAIVAWLVWSWFLTGGVLAVLTERPRGRLETARCFGGGGAAHFFRFARLGVLSLLLNLPARFALGLGVGYLSDRIATAMTICEMNGPRSWPGRRRCCTCWPRPPSTTPGPSWCCAGPPTSRWGRCGR